MVAFLIVILSFGVVVTQTASILISTNGAPELYEKDYISTNEPYNIYMKIMQNAEKSVGNKISEDERNSINDWIKKTDGVYYHAKKGEIISTNTTMLPEEFSKYKYYVLYNNNDMKTSIRNNWVHYRTPIQEFYFAFDDTFIMKKQAEFETAKSALLHILYQVLVILILGLLALVYLVYVCGRNKDGDLEMMVIDRLWTEVSTLLIFITIMVFLRIVSNVFSEFNFTEQLKPVAILVSALFCSAGLMFLLSLVRHIKNKTIIKHSVIYLVYGITRAILKTILDITPLTLKVIGAILIAELVTFFATLTIDRQELFGIFLIIFGTAGILYFITKYVLKPYDNEVKARLEMSLSKELRAEKLKTELITNVSHDLKTPLTAIINYSDLLLKENADNEYVKVIYDKSQKLKKLTEDLFEVSKAQSGNIQTDIQKLNVLELLNQTLAEFDTRNIDFKINVKNIDILADGKLMSRVFENLIGNILKYALENTRAYIDSYEEGNKVYINFKNIANYEMNFEQNEVTERFARADKSRTTEGNGLGLAIAKSYTEVCGGKFEITVDGDLFKATLIFEN